MFFHKAKVVVDSLGHADNTDFGIAGGYFVGNRVSPPQRAVAADAEEQVDLH